MTHDPAVRTPQRLVPAWLVYAMLTVVFWGAWGAVSKVVSDEISPYLNQVLFTVGLIPLVAIVFRSPRLRSGTNLRRGMAYAFVTGILGGTGNIAFYQSLTAGGQASVVVPLTGMSPLVTVLAALVILRERLTRWQVLGVGLALVAIFLLSL